MLTSESLSAISFGNLPNIFVYEAAKAYMNHEIPISIKYAMIVPCVLLSRELLCTAWQSLWTSEVLLECTSDARPDFQTSAAQTLYT